MKNRWTKVLSGLLCIAMLAAAAIPASAAGYVTSENGKTSDGVSYTVKYPKIYGTIKASVKMIERDNESGQDIEVVKNLVLPVMASGDPFIMTFTSGLTCAHCPDCDKVSSSTPPPDGSMVNMDVYDGPCMPIIDTFSVYDINEENNGAPDVFEALDGMYTGISKTPNTVLIDGQIDKVGLKSLDMIRIEDAKHFKTPGNADSDYFEFYTRFELGYYLRLPKATIDKMDFSKTYNTKELEALIKGNEVGKTRPLDIKFTDQVDLDNGVGYDYTLTNTTNAPIKGYYAFISYIPSMVQGKHSPANFVGQAHSFDVDLQPGESVSESLTSCMYGMSTVSLIWVTFEDKAERDAFFSDAAFTYVSGNSDGAYHQLDGYDGKGVQFMKDKFGITIQPVK